MRPNKLVFIILLGCLAQSTWAQNATIKIDIDRTIGQVDPKIYGNFAEHLGRCIYGGIYDPGSPLSDENGFRKDVMVAVKDLNITLIRYPGGNFVSNYHWLDGVGPKEQRVPRMELAWSRLETNQFGTNEFIKYTKALGTEPYFAVNLGTGTIEEAQNWGADLIIVGSHGYGFWSRALLGSVSNAVINHAPCSVLVVRGS